jgi:hypothetical protein
MLLAVAQTAARLVQVRASATAVLPTAGVEAHLHTAVQDARQALVTALEAMAAKVPSRPHLPVQRLPPRLLLAPRLRCSA